jgi:peroxiredoxin
MGSFRARLRALPAPLRRGLAARLYPSVLPEGSIAPEWHLQGWDDRWHRHGKRWALLVFYVDDDDDACAAQLQSFEAQRPTFAELGVDVYGVNPGEAPAHRAMAERAGITFPLLTDRGASVARLFRAAIQLPLRPWLVRTVVLVNPERRVRLANRGAPSVEALVRSVQALRQVARGGA